LVHDDLFPPLIGSLTPAWTEISAGLRARKRQNGMDSTGPRPSGEDSRVTTRDRASNGRLVHAPHVSSRHGTVTLFFPKN